MVGDDERATGVRVVSGGIARKGDKAVMVRRNRVREDGESVEKRRNSG